MNDAHKIVEQVYAAKEDVRAADGLIRAYLPFIKAETAKFFKRPPIEGQDDELSIAMMAFHEAIGGYSRARGSFLKYAAMLIRSRLVDYSRREQRHSRVISLDAPIGEEDITLGETLADDRDPHEETALRDATRAEIEELTRQMKEFGVSLSDVADNCPKQQRDFGRLPESIGIRKGKPGAVGGPFKDETPAHRAAGNGERCGAQDAGAAPQIYGGPAVDLYQRV